MNLRFLTTAILIGLMAQAAVAQKKSTGAPLETVSERKLGVVYKTVGKRKLEFDVCYTATRHILRNASRR